MIKNKRMSERFDTDKDKYFPQKYKNNDSQLVF